MNIFTAGRRINLKEWLYIAMLTSSLLPTAIFLIVGVLASQHSSGAIAMLVLLGVILAVALVFVCSLIITRLIQHKIDKLFVEATAVCQAYTGGDKHIRLHIYGNDSYAQFLSELNVLLESSVLQVRSIEPYIEKRRDKNTTALQVLERAPSSDASQEEKAIQLSNALQLAQIAKNLVDRAAFQEQAARAQAIQIFQTNEKLESLSVFVHQLSRNAQGAASLAQAGLKHIHKNQATFQQTQARLVQLKQETQWATQKVYRISGSSQVLGHIVQIVEDLSLHLTFLSHHPLLQGEQSSEITDIAFQVKTLAARATSATNEITKLVNSLETDVNEAVVALQNRDREIINKVKDVEEASQELRDLYHSMEFQAGMIEDMVQSTSEQVAIVDEATAAMNQIAKVAYQSGKETQQHIQALKKLANLSKQLHPSLPAPQTPALESPDEAPVVPHGKRYQSLE